jgi:hypothetical protein
MKHWQLCGSTAVIAILAANGAFADVTPEEVWQNWQDMATSQGQTVTSVSATRDGDVLNVTGVAISYEKDGSSFSSKIDAIDFADNGDGTVGVTLADSTVMTFKAPAAADIEGDLPTDMQLTMSQPGMELTASGTADALNYVFTAPTLSLKFEPTGDATAATGTVQADLTNASGSYLVEGDTAAKKITSDFAADSLKISASGKDDAKKTDFTIIADIADIAGKTSGTFLGAADMADIGKALKAGFMVNGSFSHGATSFSVNANEDGKPTSVAGTSEGGDVAIEMNAAHLLYAVGGKALALTVASADLPFPELKVGYQEAAFKLDMPVAKSDVPADFTLLSKLVGFTVSDEIWGMVDPAGSLPHDPATVIIDTKGKATMTADLFDEAAKLEDGTVPTPELNALDITEIKASAAGAELTGVGSFTFDNSDMTTFAGVPLPTGKLDIKLTGGNTLLDKIVAMGLLTQDDAMGYKMMVSMFANSAADKDEMTSTLEFKDKGFYANGQKLQ